MLFSPSFRTFFLPPPVQLPSYLAACLSAPARPSTNPWARLPFDSAAVMSVLLAFSPVYLPVCLLAFLIARVPARLWLRIKDLGR